MVKAVDKLRNSDFYKKLPPTSGKLWSTRLRERRHKIGVETMSPNVVDRRGEYKDPMLNNNGVITGAKTNRLPDRAPIPTKKPLPHERDDFQKEQKRSEKKDRPKKKNNLVTPGNWETKNKI